MTNDYKIIQRPKGESNVGTGIKLKNKHKVRIAGVVLRLEVVPRHNGYGCDYRLTIVLPNDKQIEVEDVQSTVSFDDLMAALYEGAIGVKPVGGESNKSYVMGGLPMNVREVVEDLSEDITESVDPLEEKLATLPKTETKPIPKADGQEASAKRSGQTENQSMTTEGMDINAEVRKQRAEMARRNRDAEMGLGIM